MVKSGRNPAEEQNGIIVSWTNGFEFTGRRGLRVCKLLTGLLLACALATAGSAEQSVSNDAAFTAVRFETIANEPVALRGFLQRFPKGADLHSHLSGAVYAETYVEWAVEDGLCLLLVHWTVAVPPCDAADGRPTIGEALDQRIVTRDQVINAWSLRGFVAGETTGHEKFFASFGRFGAAIEGRTGEMLAEVVARAGAQNVRYLELMVSYGTWAASELGAQIGWNPDLDQLHRQLLDAGLEDLVGTSRAEVARDLDRMRNVLGCDGPAADPGCDVKVRILAQVNRNVEPEQLFAQVSLAHELVLAEPLVVGFNLVAPEDHTITLGDYMSQMETLATLARLRPGVPLTLHAGELSLGLVPPRHLRDHIRLAVEVAGARRIGHGVALAYDRDPAELLARMAKDGVMVEINLTSNEQILGVSGSAHPFLTYMAAGVPVALSTDDEGVSRIDLTHEYQSAVEAYRLDYTALKLLSRNGLTYAFLPGESLWEEPGEALPVTSCAGEILGAVEPGSACTAFLDSSEKARLQWALEGDFAKFERAEANAALIEWISRSTPRHQALP
jgi:adenosine deaminase